MVKYLPNVLSSPYLSLTSGNVHSIFFPCFPASTPQLSMNVLRLSLRMKNSQQEVREKYEKQCLQLTHSSVLAWRIPGTAGPGGLPSMGSHRVGHD